MPDKSEPTEARSPEARELAVIRKAEGLELVERLVEVLEAEGLEKLEVQEIEELEKFEVQEIEELELVEIQEIDHQVFDWNLAQFQYNQECFPKVGWTLQVLEQ